MTTAEFKSRRAASDDRDLKAADLIVASVALAVTVIWAHFLVEVLL